MAENIVLDKQIIEKAKSVSCKVEDFAARKRVYALNIAANAMEEYLQSKGFAVNTKSSLYKIPAFAQDIEIADIYVNNIKLDVRVTFDDNSFYIPKIQEKYNAQPCAYLVAKLDFALNNIKILGFVDAQSLEKQTNATEYYCYKTALLKPIDELKTFIYNAKPQTAIPTPEEIEKTKELAVSFFENSISDSEKVYFIKNVIKYAACREILADMNDFDKVANQIANYEELLNDSTLSVLSGNKKEVDEALLANMATLENAEENLEETQEPADKTEDVVLEDELLDLDEESGLDLDKGDEIPMLEELNEDETAEEVKEAADETLEKSAESEIEEVIEDEINDSDTISLEDVEPETETLLEFKDETEEEIIKPMGVISTDTTEGAFDLTETENAQPIEMLDLQDSEENMSEYSFAEEKISEEPENKNEETDEVDEIKLQFEEDEFSEFSKEIVEENITENSDEGETEILHEAEIIEEAEILEETAALEETEMLEEVAEDKDSISEEDNILEEDSIHNLEDSDDFLLEHDDSDDMLLEDFDEEPSKPETKPSTEILAQETPRKPFKLTLEGEEDEDEKEKEEENIEEPEEIEEITESEQIVEEKTVYSSQEPVEMVYDDEDGEDEKGDEKLDTAFENLSDIEPQIAENKEETPQDSDDSQIQELLDDDLLALLASESEERENEAAEAKREEFAQIQTSSEVDDVVAADSQDVVEYTENTLSDEGETLNQEDSEQKEYQENETIEALYDSDETAQDSEGKEFELAQEPVSEKTVNATKNIIIAAALLLFLAGSGTAAWFVNHAKTADNNAVDTANQDGELFDFQNSSAQSNDDAAPALSQDINKSMTNSFSDKPAAITITKLSWQVSEKLASENSVKEYLQTTGKNIQIKLQNDLANAADINFNNSIKVSFEISPDNTLKGMQILESSGSDQIDDMVQRSIKETLKYISVPKLKDFKSDYFLTLIINF